MLSTFFPGWISCSGYFRNSAFTPIGPTRALFTSVEGLSPLLVNIWCLRLPTSWLSPCGGETSLFFILSFPPKHSVHGSRPKYSIPERHLSRTSVFTRSCSPIQGSALSPSLLALKMTNLTVLSTWLGGGTYLLLISMNHYAMSSCNGDYILAIFFRSHQKEQ